MSEKRQLILSVQKALRLLDIIIEKGGISVAEAAKTLDSDRSSAYRMLETLGEMGYADKDPKSSLYGVGLRLEEYRLKGPDQAEIYSAARPLMKQVAEETNETVHLCKYSPAGMLFIGQEAGPEIINIARDVLASEPLYCTATGRAVLAFMPEELRAAIIRNTKFIKYTANTVETPAALEAELENTRRTGCAVDNCELHEGVFCIAAPVFTGRRMPVYSLGISAPVYRFSGERVESCTALLIEAAKKLSEAFGKRYDAAAIY